MKGFRFFTGSFAFVLIFSALAFAQAESAQTSVTNKIAVIDTEAFDNEESGIKEIVETYDKIEIEFKPQSDELKTLAEKSQKFQKEIKFFQSVAERIEGICVSDEINKKFEDYDKLTKEYKRRQDEIKSLYDKRKSEVFADINKKIGEAIKQFAKEKGYFMILDISKANESVIIENPENYDITKEFIKYYNEKFAETKKQGFA